MRPRHVVGHELLQIERGGDGAAEGDVGCVVDVGHLAVEHAAIAGEQRQPPHRLGDFVAGSQKLLGQGIVVAEQRRQVGAQRHPGGAGQRGAIDHHRRFLRGAFEQGVAQDQPSFGVGVADLDGDALARRHHIERPEGIARHAVLDRRHQQAQAHRQPGRHHHGGDGHHGRRTRHVLLHVQHAGRGLEVEAAGIEAHALADQRDLGIALAAPHKIDQPRRAAAGAANGMNHGIVLLQEIVAHDHADLGLVRLAERLRRCRKLGRPHVG